MRELLDQLNATSTKERQQLAAAAQRHDQGNDLLGLRFKAHDRVVDLSTGKRGVVERAERDVLTRYERYQVRLEDARVVFRTEKELERRVD